MKEDLGLELVKYPPQGGLVPDITFHMVNELFQADNRVKVMWVLRWQGEPHDICSQVLKAQAEPGALEAGVPGHQQPLAGKE